MARLTVQTIATALAILIGTVGCANKPSEELARTFDRSLDSENPGVTDTEIKIGFIVVDQTRLASIVGFDNPDTGDQPAQILTLVEDLNRRGGIAGRTVVPIIKVFDAFSDSAANEEKLCRSFTEDDPVFAVVMNGMFQANARPCYAKSNVLMLDYTLFPLDEAAAGDLRPLLYQPQLMDYSTLMSGLIRSAGQQQFFDGANRVGVLAIDNAQNRRVMSNAVEPALAAAGVSDPLIAWVDPTSGSTLEAGQGQAVLAFKEAKVDRVFVVGGSRLLAFFLTISMPQQFLPRYAITSFDNAAFAARNSPAGLRGALGVSLAPSIDVADDAVPFPFNDAEGTCLERLSQGGHQLPARSNARPGLIACDALNLLQSALTGSASPSGEAFFAGLDGAEFESALLWQSQPRSASAFASSGIRPMSFDPDCRCFALTGATESSQQ